MATSTVEDYLKCIYLEEQSKRGALVPTGQVAAALQVAPGTATSMVKTLADSGLVDYEPYVGVRLTSAGQRLATRVLRRHRLVESFLVRVMGMSWSEVHGDAELLEHAVSERLIERIDEMLGYPSADPHGDPIPTAGGEIPERSDLASLVECPLDARQALVRVTDQRAEFLRLLERHALLPGCRLAVVSRDELADTVEIAPERGEHLQLGFRAASRILVEPASDGAVA
jgi:DtxR family Mn-dependent transcriptional regulator